MRTSCKTQQLLFQFIYLLLHCFPCLTSHSLPKKAILFLFELM
uniref:Uncharacterized protein n=1 Tax=Anguilla anguilla TaxID=7936 RepID=A0A0E9RV04_ANGAN